MAANGVVRQLELVALADEHPERALAVPWRSRRLGEAAPQERERGFELAFVVLGGHGVLDELGGHPEGAQPLLDPLRAPTVEPPAILGEAGIVEIALLAQLPDHGVDDRGLDPLAREHASELGDRVVAAVERRPRDLPRVLEAHLGVG